MGSLRTFHIFFMLVVMAAVEFFGIWALWDYQTSQNTTTLAMGLIGLVLGLALIPYTVWFIRKLNRAHIT